MATPSLAMIPSGYKASKVYSVLPESGVGDFTFSRGSNATRVNKDGLIEEVLELGEELVINGGFDTDSDWTKGTGWSISDGKVIATNAPNLQRLQNSGNDASVIGKTYKYSISVSNVSGAYSLYVFGVYTLSSSSTEGTIEGYVTATSTNGTVFIAAATSGGLVSATIDNVSVKEVISFDLPRLDYTDSSCPSLLLEPQSTNLVEYSNDFSGLSGGFVTPNYGISPEGLSASRVLFTGANQSMSSGTSLGTGVVCNFSAYVKGVQGKTIKFAAGGVDISHTFSGEWERLSGSATSINSSWNFNTYGGATARDFQVCGTQLEEQSYSTSYIPTNGAIATRLADVCTDAGTSATFNDSEGVLYVNTATLQEGVTEKIISLSDGTTSNNIYFSFSGTAN
ncbi:MAG: hypothetical protein GY834_15165, partial [Bacteroidetes bacterium]|nr:hypothetical protein [Bacteroidota bacterium]